jgi:hypothetical protein
MAHLIDEPRSKAALVWIFGQYLEHFENPQGYVEKYLSTNFLEEPYEIQL